MCSGPPFWNVLCYAYSGPYPMSLSYLLSGGTKNINSFSSELLPKTSSSSSLSLLPINYVFSWDQRKDFQRSASVGGSIFYIFCISLPLPPPHHDAVHSSVLDRFPSVHLYSQVPVPAMIIWGEKNHGPETILSALVTEHSSPILSNPSSKRDFSKTPTVRNSEGSLWSQGPHGCSPPLLRSLDIFEVTPLEAVWSQPVSLGSTFRAFLAGHPPPFTVNN